MPCYDVEGHSMVWKTFIIYWIKTILNVMYSMIILRFKGMNTNKTKTGRKCARDYQKVNRNHLHMGSDYG